MDERKSIGDGGASASASGDSSRMVSSFERVGERTRFTVELRPGETTIVSWKKLMKDVTKSKNASAPATTTAAERPTVGGVHAALESRLGPAQPTPKDLEDAAPPNRMSAVIEKIERLYMGKDSSDDEDLDDIPDDDQYDTEDSFIDDKELDEYFEVDKAKTKHDGFFVNRGKLESVEPSLSSDQLPKKRRRKSGENDLGNAPNKHLKVGQKSGGRRVHSVPHSLSVRGENHSIASGTYLPKIVSDDSFHTKHHERSGSSQLKLQSGKGYYVEDSEKSIQQKDKNGNREQFDLNVAIGAQSVQTAKTSVAYRKEGSGLRPKGNLLEKAIRELEKMVAELRPRNGDLPDVDATSQGTKRRLPQEIKYKLAKVARLAHVSQGKFSKELLGRLMNIVGHLINLRTLKRNLKILINTSLSANEEKHEKFQQIKKEVVDMINVRMPSLIAKAGERQAGASDDFQESGHGEKVATKVKCTMDAALEDKICDLYDIFVDGLDEDAAPQVRKLYAELAELWPKGLMDNHGIKRAICHAKERRRNLHDRNKEREKFGRKKLGTTKVDETARVEVSSATQPQYVQERVSTDYGTQVPSCHSRFASNTSTAVTTTATASPSNIALSIPSAMTSAPTTEWSKHEKSKGSFNGSHGADMRNSNEQLVKKKVKRKPEIDQGEAHLRPEKVSSRHSDEKSKSHKHHSSSGQTMGVPQKASFQSPSIPSFEQLS